MCFAIVFGSVQREHIFFLRTYNKENKQVGLNTLLRGSLLLHTASPIATNKEISILLQKYCNLYPFQVIIHTDAVCHWCRNASLRPFPAIIHFCKKIDNGRNTGQGHQDNPKRDTTLGLRTQRKLVWSIQSRRIQLLVAIRTLCKKRLHTSLRLIVRIEKKV